MEDVNDLSNNASIESSNDKDDETEAVSESVTVQILKSLILR